MAVDKDAWEKKAQDAWDEFEAEGSAPVNLKALVSDVKAALQKKKAANTKVSKKAKAAAKKRTQADAKIAAVVEKAVAGPDPEVERKRLAALNYQIKVTKDIDQLKRNIDTAVANIESLQPSTVADLGKQLKAVQTSIKSAPVGVDRDSLSELIKTVGVEIGQLAVVARDHKKVARQKELDDQARIRKAKQEANRPVPKPVAEQKRPSFLQAFQDERKRQTEFKDSFVGPQRKRGSLMQQVDKIRGILGAGARAAATSTGVGGQVGKALSYLQSPQAPLIVRALNSIAKGTMMTGKAVARAGEDSLKWISKRMFGLTRMFSRLLNGGAVSDGFGMLGKLLGGGVFLGAVLKPILEGIDGELKKRFGDNYVESFISGLWSKAWGYLIKQIKDFLGITEESNPIGKANDALDPSAEPRAIMDAATPAVPLTKEQKVAKEKALEAYRAELDKGTFLQKYYQIGLTPAQKAAKDRYEASLKGELSINGSATTVTGGRTTNVTGSPVTVNSATTSSATTSSSNTAPASPAGAGRGNSPAMVTPSPVSTPPMEGARTATPPAPKASPTSPSNSGASSSSSSSSSGAIGVAQVPTFASSESLQFMSMGLVT